MRTISEVMFILKEIRKKKKISVLEVVEYIEHETNIQVSTKTVYGWEEGTSKPDIICFIALCSLYQIQDINELFIENGMDFNADVTLKDKLYNAYKERPQLQYAIHILLGIK